MSIKDNLKAKIKEYLESNEGNIDMHGLSPDEPANIEVMMNKIIEIVCEQVEYNKHMEALDRKFSFNR